MRVARTLSLLVVLHLVACRAASDPEVTDGASVPPGATAIQVRAFPEPVASLLYTGVPDPRRVVIRDAVAWGQLWAEVTAHVTPRPALPVVDFAQEEVVVAASGTKPSGGHAIAIDGVYESDGRRFVAVRETSPDANCFVTGALTSPLAAVRVARSTAPVTFVEQRETRRCD